MSIKEVDNAIHNLLENDDAMETPGSCRYAADRMMQVAEKADVTPPYVKKEVLVYPEASSTAERIHYAFRVSSSEGDKVYNPNPAALFPQYLGDIKSAPGLISHMKVTEKVI